MGAEFSGPSTSSQAVCSLKLTDVVDTVSESSITVILCFFVKLFKYCYCIRFLDGRGQWAEGRRFSVLLHHQD